MIGERTPENIPPCAGLSLNLVAANFRLQAKWRSLRSKESEIPSFAGPGLLALQRGILNVK